MKRVNLGSKNNARWSGKDLERALSMMAALESRISTLERTVAENMTTITKLKGSPVPRQTDVYESALERRDTFFCRGYTGWE